MRGLKKAFSQREAKEKQRGGGITMKEESKKEKEGKEGAHLSHTPAYPECVDAEDRLWLVAN